MYICMYVCMDRWMDGWMYECMDGWMDGCMYGYMYVLKTHCHQFDIIHSFTLIFATMKQPLQCRYGMVWMKC